MSKYVSARVPGSAATTGVEDESVRQALQPLVDAHNTRNSSGLEGFVTRRELTDRVPGLVNSAIGETFGVPVTPGGGSSWFQQFSDKIFNSAVWRKISEQITWLTVENNRLLARVKELDDGIFHEQIISEGLVSELRVLKTTSGGLAAIAAESTVRADADAAFAETINLMWATVGNNSALIYENGTVTVNYTEATASKWTQLQAEVFGAEGEEPIRVALNQESFARASLEDGIEATWTVRINADGRWAGFGLGLEGQPGSVQSTFIIAADNFALVQPGVEAGMEYTPFGVDANGIYMNGTVRIDTTGQSLADFVANVLLEQTALAFVELQDGTVVPPSITFTASVANMPGATYQWLVDGMVVSGQTANTYAVPQFTNTSSKRVTVRVTSGTVIREDSQSVFFVREGADAITAGLTNEAHGVPATEAGTVLNYTGAGGTFVVARGSTILTGADVTFSVLSFVGFTNGLGISINAITGEYAVTSGLADDVGTVTFRAALLDGTELFKVFTITKAKVGATGSPGLNSATINIYLRAAEAPLLPSLNTTYTFSTKTLTGLNNAWATEIPAGDLPLYVSAATASSAEDTDIITPAEWATPVILAKDGLKTATVYLFRRTTFGTPALPTSVSTYTFATGVLTGHNNSWSQTMPTTGGTYRWMTTATALAAGGVATDTIAGTEWAGAALLAEDGVKGDQGDPGTPGTPGDPGATGDRGPGDFYGLYETVPTIGTTTWNSNAITIIFNATGSTARFIGDTVTIYNSTTVRVGRWNGSSWTDHGVVIDGALVVNGTITGQKLAANSIITNNAQIENATVTRLKITGLAYVADTVPCVDGTADGNALHSTGRFILPYAVVIPPAGYTITGWHVRAMGSNDFDYRVFAFTNAGVGYTGNISVAWGYL